MKIATTVTYLGLGAVELDPDSATSWVERPIVLETVFGGSIVLGGGATVSPDLGNLIEGRLNGIYTGAAAVSAIVEEETEALAALAESAVQPEALDAALAGKVDKIDGYGLSQSNFTADEKAKLAGIEGSHYRGTFTATESLPADGEPGDYADVDEGVGQDVIRYIWDASDDEWIAQAAPASPLTGAQIKALYEGEPDTNAFGDADKIKLDGIAAEATKNASDSSLRDRSTHTGTQAQSTITGLTTALADLNARTVVTQLTQAAYDALPTKDSNTLYVIIG